MMSDRNWGKISSGETFESLATTLVFFEDSGAALFGRRGKDGGQDARSGDGKRVFQAKHHQDGATAKAIADAKKEATKIEKYRAAGNTREPQWRGVTHWRLVTNVAFNPTDRQVWDSEVVPLFQAQGLVADYWEQANLNALLDKHPEVDRAYFQNMTRALLSLPEVKQMLPTQEPFLRRDTLGTFVGRGDEIASIRSFLNSSHLFLVTHGAGGAGKTRIVMEAGEQVAAEGVWQVLWGNVASMEASGAWFDAIVPERPTLLILDEPENEQVLRILAEQLGGKVGRVSQWKIAITVRSPKDPVLKFLFGPRMKSRVEQLCIGALPPADAETMCMDLIGSGALCGTQVEWRTKTAKELAKRFCSHPVWLTLAVHVLESAGDLAGVPQTAEDLADYYLSEVVSEQSDYAADTLRTLLQWVALIGTVNREDDTTVEVIASQANLGNLNAARRALASLVDRKALTERGARNRFVELKPDVMRDRVLLKWLSVDVGYGTNPVQPSEDANQIAVAVSKAILSGTLSAVGRAILTSLARTELILDLSGKSVPLLGPIMHGLESGISNTNASTRKGIAEMLLDIAAYRPDDTVNLSRTLRTLPCATEPVEGIFGPREVGHDDVVLELAWPVFHSAFGAQSLAARERVLTELCELAEVEADIAYRRPRGLPNDGKRAKNLIGRTLEGGPQFWSDFEDAAATVGSKLLDETGGHVPPVSRVEVLKALVGPATSVERRQTWSEGYKVIMQTSTILPGHPAWATRETLISKIKVLLSRDETPQATRSTLWMLFAEAHRGLNQRSAQGPQEVQTIMRQEMLSDMIWARPVLAGRTEHLDEIAAARGLWDWHARFEKYGELRDAAEQLEKLYKTNQLAAEFEWLLSRDEWKARGQRAAEKASELALGGHDAIEAFLKRAENFLESEKNLYQISSVACELGEKAEEADGIRHFILATLGQPEVSPRADLAAVAANRWAAARRRREPTSAQALVLELADACGSNAQKINLLQRIYGQLPRPKDFGDLSDAEFLFVRSHEKLFTEAAQIPAFVSCIAWGVDFEWPSLKALVERVLDVTPDEQAAQTLAILVDAFYWAVSEREPIAVPTDLGSWMLDQLLRVPDIDCLGGNLEWYISEVLKRVGKPPLIWLPRALVRRRDLEAQRGHENVRSISSQMRLTSFVASINEDSDIDADTRAAVCELLNFFTDRGSVGYYLDKLLHDVDPNGRVVADEVARRLAEASDKDTVYQFARIGGAFAIGTPAWRTIAKPVLVRAARSEKDERMSLFSSLTYHGVRSWAGTPGVVPAIFISEVESARQRLETETDTDFRPFWEWCLAVAEEDLRYQEEHAKEERGE
jgi:hypothetical protein